MRKVAIFDIDGTIFRSSLLNELVNEFVKVGIFPKKVEKIYIKDYQAWLDRKGSYEKYLNSLVDAFVQNIKGVKYTDFSRLVKKVTDYHKNRVYRYTRDLVKDLKKKNYYLLAISNSPKEIVNNFCKKLGFDKIYGRVYQIDKQKKFTGEILYLDIISDKAKVLHRAVEKEKLTLKGSVGVGDTESDIAFLELVDKPICFNPNQKLYRRAKRSGWKIVVERKDVIYYL